jgi:hypothetical protein
MSCERRQGFSEQKIPLKRRERRNQQHQRRDLSRLAMPHHPHQERRRQNRRTDDGPRQGGPKRGRPVPMGVSNRRHRYHGRDRRSEILRTGRAPNARRRQALLHERSGGYREDTDQGRCNGRPRQRAQAPAANLGARTSATPPIPTPRPVRFWPEVSGGRKSPRSMPCTAVVERRGAT